MVNYLSLVWITASTVGKVILCCAVGMFISRYFGNPQHSEKGFTYISVRILLPLLLFSNLCLSVTWESVQLYYWAPIIAIFPILVGIGGACVCKTFLNSTYTGMLILGCSFQNGLTFPVSLLMNLKGIEWFGPAQLESSLNHIFLYNIVCSIGLWAIGEPNLLKKKTALEELRRQQAQLGHGPHTGSPISGVVFPFSSMEARGTGESSEPSSPNGGQDASTFQQFAWYRPADPLDAPINPASIAPPVPIAEGEEGDVIARTEEGRGFSGGAFCGLFMTMLAAMKSPTVGGSILAIFISLTMPGEILLSGFALIGSGAIPLQLLVLGATVIQKKDPEASTADAHEGGEVVEASPRTWLDTLKSQQSLFIISSITIRLVVVPAICLGLIHLLSSHRVIPNERIFVLSMLVATCSPSAINSSIICVMHEYHAREYSQMIFVMYVSAIFFTTVWLFIYILYLEAVFESNVAMGVNYLSLVWITASTVGKVILCCAVGMFIARYFSHREHSEKGFTYICVRILFPLLLFSSLCLSVSWESLGLYYWAPIMALFPIVLGIAGACVCKVFLNNTYTGMLILGCTFQNGLTYPVSLLMNLKGISWFGPAELEIGLAHIFLYNVVCSLGLWGIGEPVIKYFKAKELADEKLAMEELRRQQLTTLPDKAGGSSKGIVFPFSTVADHAAVSIEEQKKQNISQSASTFQQFAWYRPADPLDAPINPASIAPPVPIAEGEEGDVIARTEEGKSSIAATICGGLRTAVKGLKSPIVAGCLLAIFISLVPPLRWLAETMPGEILLSGFALIGNGAIPLQLLVLGATVIQKKDPEASNADAHEGGEVVEASPRTWLDTLKSQQSLFIISSITIRLVVVPAICFGLIHVLSTHNVIPNDRVFLLSMFIGTCCPSAINSSIICVMHEYHAREYSQMIFVMYVSAIFFTTVWLFIYILYIES
eukprot:gene4070-2919_t